MTSEQPAPVVVVTGANGFVGARTCAELAKRGATVRAVVRRPGTAPTGAGVEEWVGEFADPDFAAAVVAGATGVVTTVHPMGSDRATQHRVGVEGTRSSPGRPGTPAWRGSCTCRPRASTTGRSVSAMSTNQPRW